MIVSGFSYYYKTIIATAIRLGSPKFALYNSSASLDPSSTTTYTSTNEVSSAGYSAGGQSMIVSSFGLIDDVYCLDYQDLTWSDPSLSFTTRGGIIYLSGSGNAVVGIIDFGFNYTASGSFTITFPSPTKTESIIRIK